MAAFFGTLNGPKNEKFRWAPSLGLFYTISYHHAKFHAFTPFCLILIEIMFGHVC